MLAHFAEYTDIVGDHPLNLQTTTLALNAYLIAGEAKYRDWIVEYVDAWRERTAANGGIIPTNVGLDGTLGGACDGKWWGGTYGWGFTIDDYLNPGSGGRIHRHMFLERAPQAFGNALLATGDQAYVDTWRGVIEGVNANARVVGGQTLYPHNYGDEEGSPGWYNYTPEPYTNGALPVWFWSMREADKELIAGHEWIRYLDGADPDYPLTALQQEFAELRRRGQRLQADTSSPDTRMSDDPMGANPALTTALIRLMLGGYEPRHYGFPLHCRLRYFDPERRRPGIPPAVAALVDSMSATEVAVTLVNLDQVTGRSVVVQAGAYGEHRFGVVTAGTARATIERPCVTVHLGPGCGARLVCEQHRYTEQPSFTFPWDRVE